MAKDKPAAEQRSKIEAQRRAAQSALDKNRVETGRGKARSLTPRERSAYQRVIARTESSDFIHWGPEEIVAEADELDLREKTGGSLKYMDFYNAAAIKYPYADNAYFIFTTCCQWWEIL